MSYDELQKYRDQEPFAPPWSNHLKTFGQMVADCRSLMDSLDMRPTAADAIRMAEIVMARVDRSGVGLQRSWNDASTDERERLLRAVRGE